MSRSSSELTQDGIFDLLSNPRRRFVLYYLSQENDPVDFGTLADEVAAWENDTTVAEIDSQERKRVYVSLYQTHIPKLEEAGLVEHDQESGTVRLTGRIDELTPYLKQETPSPPWPVYYLLVAVAGGGLYLAKLLGVPGIALLPTVFVNTLVLGTLLVLVVVHYQYTKRARTRAFSDLVRER